MLKNYIPKFIYDIDIIKDMLNAIQPQEDRLNDNVDSLLNDLHILSTTVIRRFELDYGIKPDPSIPFEDRVLAVLNKKNIKTTFSDTNFRKTVELNYSKKYEIIYDYLNYEFSLILLDNKPINNLIKAIEKAKPAHLDFILAILIGFDKVEITEKSFLLSNLVKRAGTFRSGENVI